MKDIIIKEIWTDLISPWDMNIEEPKYSLKSGFIKEVLKDLINSINVDLLMTIWSAKSIVFSKNSRKKLLVPNDILMEPINSLNLDLCMELQRKIHHLNVDLSKYIIWSPQMNLERPYHFLKHRYIKANFKDLRSSLNLDLFQKC